MIRVFFPLLLLLTAAAACKPRGRCDAKPGPLPVQLLALGGPNLNPRAEDEAPCPVTFSVFQLKSGAGLDELDFETVLDQREKAFGDAFLKVEQHVIFPGGHERWLLEIDPNATHLVTVAEFREPLGDAWYQVYAVPRDHPQQACDAAARGKPIGDPCLYLSFEEFEVSGGQFPAAGFDLRTFETTCAPVATLPAKKRRKRRDLRMPSLPPTDIPQPPSLNPPTTPAAPAEPPAQFPE